VEQDASYKPAEVKNPEKIYATLQECRDTSGLKKTEGRLPSCQFLFCLCLINLIIFSNGVVSLESYYSAVCKKSGYLYKRNDKNKKWKSMFFVLQMDGTDTHLLIFESPKASNHVFILRFHVWLSRRKLCIERLIKFLIFLSFDQRTKPKGLVDLGCAYLYPLHDSFFDKPYCLQLVERALPCLATVSYLCAPSQDEFQVPHKQFN